MAFTDGIDSFYQSVKARILAVNSSRVVAGLLVAQDWPPKNLKTNAFYLLTLGENTIGKQGYSPTVPIEQHLVQWVWIIPGTDIAAGTRAASRGDRFRTNYAMKGELVNGLYPFYTEKKTWAVNANGNWIGTSYSPKEFILWTPPRYVDRLDKDSGLVYGTVSTQITSMLDVITA